MKRKPPAKCKPGRKAKPRKKPPPYELAVEGDCWTVVKRKRRKVPRG